MTDQTPDAPELTEVEASAEVSDEEITEQKAVRLTKRQRLIDSGAGAYPVGVAITTTIPALRAKYPALEADATTADHVGIAGRVVHLRNTGKLCFASLQAGDGQRIQAMISLAEVGEQSLERWKDLVDLGDHVFVTGEVISSRRGELSVLATDWAIAAKAIMPLPNLHTELSDEARVRTRYLDLIVREQARSSVRARAAVNASLRATFTAHEYLADAPPCCTCSIGVSTSR